MQKHHVPRRSVNIPTYPPRGASSVCFQEPFDVPATIYGVASAKASVSVSSGDGNLNLGSFGEIFRQPAARPKMAEHPTMVYEGLRGAVEAQGRCHFAHYDTTTHPVIELWHCKMLVFPYMYRLQGQSYTARSACN